MVLVFKSQVYNILGCFRYDMTNRKKLRRVHLHVCFWARNLRAVQMMLGCLNYDIVCYLLCITIHLFIHPSIHLSIYLSICFLLGMIGDTGSFASWGLFDFVFFMLRTPRRISRWSSDGRYGNLTATLVVCDHHITMIIIGLSGWWSSLFCSYPGYLFFTTWHATK